MKADNEPASSAVVVPGYVVAERLGVGGFGEVYRARHDVIDREVAIKILHAKYSADPAAVKRFVDEARAVNKVSHPNIVEISDFGVLPDGRQYCVMELIHGTTLRDVLRQRSYLPLEDALPILRGIAEAVDAAHAMGIAHRDLKPDNVFVLPDGGVKLIDFGLAKLTHEDAVSVTETGAVFGTPLYMSPEQCRGNAVTVATDAYSFGVLAYQVLVGEPPFTGEALELALHHVNDSPVPPSRRRAGLDARVDRVLLALLDKDPARRPMPLVLAIAALTKGPQPRRQFRHRMFAAGVITAALAAAGFALLGPLREPERRDMKGPLDTGDARHGPTTRCGGDVAVADPYVVRVIVDDGENGDAAYPGATVEMRSRTTDDVLASGITASDGTITLSVPSGGKPVDAYLKATGVAPYAATYLESDTGMTAPGLTLPLYAASSHEEITRAAGRPWDPTRGIVAVFVECGHTGVDQASVVIEPGSRTIYFDDTGRPAPAARSTTARMSQGVDFGVPDGPIEVRTVARGVSRTFRARAHAGGYTRVFIQQPFE